MSISIHGIEDIQQSALRLSNQTEKLLDRLGGTVEQANQVLGNVSQGVSDVIESMNGTLVEVTGLLKSLTNSSEKLLIRVDRALELSTLVLVPLLALVFFALSICLILYGVAKLRKTRRSDSNGSSYRQMYRVETQLSDRTLHYDEKQPDKFGSVSEK
ncbi:unnamed protein product, partial [Mesorhabditis belari]|uniref:Uncharacterized protein n=1 Tax=Mesorhabditis belari TaxID=2138241 RepID=A0AAF3EZH1_9BILA